MKAKHFFVSVILGTLICFGVLVGLMSSVDPFFVLRGVDKGETARFNNQRYQMAGLIRHQEYTNLVAGTSLVANYRASWFTNRLEMETLKVTIPDGWISEFDTALKLAFRTHPDLEQVWFCLDPNILIRPESQRTVDLPRYLYNQNPLDDVEYFLNADTYQEAMRSWLRRDTEEMVPLDEAYVWDGAYTFSRASALAGYPRPEVSETVLPSDAYLGVAEENLNVVLGWVEQHPGVHFELWFPPYSILYWDKTTREGTADAVITAVEYAASRLLEYDNVTLHSFLYTDVATDLNNYTDHIHCSGSVTAWMAQHMMSGYFLLTPERYMEDLEGLREFIHSYDYEAIFK